MTRDLSDFDLVSAMRRLYETGDYYHRLEPDPDLGTDDNYWTDVVDPDGNRRDRLAERDLYLADMRDELDFIAGLTPGSVLDIGCGPGWLLSAIDPAWSRHGVETSAAAAAVARAGGEIFVGPFELADYGAASFDLVVMHHVIEHLDDPVAVIRRVHSLIRPGGSLLIATPDFDSGCARRFGHNYRMLHDPTHISLFSNDSMHRFLRDHGFRILRVAYPYFESRWFNKENLLRMLDNDTMSPPFYGNFMTFYCQRP